MEARAPVPVAWADGFERGRIAYTAIRHTAESFAEAWFLRHLENELDWTMRREVQWLPKSMGRLMARDQPIIGPPSQVLSSLP